MDLFCLDQFLTLPILAQTEIGEPVLTLASAYCF